MEVNENDVKDMPGMEMRGEKVETAEEVTGETGRREILNMLDPKLPSRADIDEHELTHLPYMNWCRQCRLGRGRETPHKKGKDKELSMPEVLWDFIS